MRLIIPWIGIYMISIAAVFCFAMALSLDDEAILSLVWPLWLVRSAWRAWRRPKPGTERVRVVYRYPARTRLASVVSWLWCLVITAAVAWLVWRIHR